VVVLLVDLAIKRGPYYTPQQLARLSQVVALQCLVGLAAAGLLLRLHWRKLAAAGRKEVVALQLTSKLGRGGVSERATPAAQPHHHQQSQSQQQQHSADQSFI
jgi:hypothetical protein